ncbi:Fungal specific transcription factor domain-containing protein [Colletotrichum higginsianum IMI 349063]|uniref:Fungal specific transcription factor domain-containing protein n=1 Tax=Colletotrichum higginsianum (strain IMI 349063) TaxID=759273 RepID=A0A1B7XRH8_COLHI|nr:Fungal specific transcription factor domain-containing protein [Colletotrichum higginsianum IMI 349063]OBR02360.1 Fungal specific transcription factor domain-containing protein [Colletotrichum higginsianum IMI 349063]
MCQQVYFPTDECTLSAFIIVNSGLCNLLRDFDDDTIKDMGVGTPTVASSISICATNVMRAVLDLRLTLDATFENITALRRHGWTGQEAGYHRLPAASTSEEVRNKCLVFCPTLPDHDITTTRPLCPGDIDITWGHGFLSWLDSVRLQHEIYQHLYSGQAQTQSPETKTQHAQMFVERLLAMRQDFVAGKAGDGSESTRADVTAAEESFQLMFYSLLTLVYRVMPVTEQGHPLLFCDDCTSAARAALNIQRRAWEKIGAVNDENWKLFLHWSVPLLLESRLIPRTEVARTLICSPFVPFIVVFSNAIATGDEADLQLLDQVVSSLQCAAQQSPSIAKLHHVCNAYHRVGRLYFDGGHQKRKILESGETYNDSVQGSSNDLTGTPSTLDSNGVLPIIAWDGLFDEWNPRLGEENALEVNSFLGNYFSGNLEF